MSDHGAQPATRLFDLSRDVLITTEASESRRERSMPAASTLSSSPPLPDGRDRITQRPDSTRSRSITRPERFCLPPGRLEFDANARTPASTMSAGKGDPIVPLRAA